LRFVSGNRGAKGIPKWNGPRCSGNGPEGFVKLFHVFLCAPSNFGATKSNMNAFAAFDLPTSICQRSDSSRKTPLAPAHEYRSQRWRSWSHFRHLRHPSQSGVTGWGFRTFQAYHRHRTPCRCRGSPPTGRSGPAACAPAHVASLLLQISRSALWLRIVQASNLQQEVYC
jgi:hypothetical protein